MKADTKSAQGFQSKRPVWQFDQHSISYVRAEQNLHEHLHKCCNHYSLDRKRIST